MRLRNLVVDGPGSLGGRARARRWELFGELFPDVAEYSVLDLGGTPGAWLRAPVQPRSVTVLNLHRDQFALPDGQDEMPSWIEVVHGDACEPPDDVIARDYDLVFSNSLIEHVGGPYRRQMLADVVSEAGRHYWLQTPYRYFPVEPHWVGPGLQFLPLAAKAWMCQKWPLIHSPAQSHHQGVEIALGVELISITELRHLLPDATIHLERFAGLPKSIVAFRS